MLQNASDTGLAVRVLGVCHFRGGGGGEAEAGSAPTRPETHKSEAETRGKYAF